ncbi:hypothetical protein [Paraburkholderia tropica]|uniref:hypothetical protein n=1 Tax=Paraburkholderia tropica TaxID=92647 RepID=UPI002ABDB28F|nr:hypothetical protein [Paraburkholderia tropica]
MHTKSKIRGECIVGSVPKKKPSRRVERQLSVAIDLALVHVVAEFTPRRYVEWMTTANAEIGRALKRAILDEQFEQRRMATAKATL